MNTTVRKNKKLLFFKNKSIYNAMRGPHHKKVKSILHDLITKSNSNYKLEGKLEPIIEEYFPRIEQHTSDSQSTNNNRSNDNDDDDHDNIPGKHANRGDILLRNNTNGKVLIIDLKLTDPFAKGVKQHTYATQPANQGEEVKRKQYNKLYDMQTTSTTQMIFLTLTTFGAPSKDTKEFVKILFADEPTETQKFKTQQFYERLSSAIQSIKSLNIQNTIKYYTTKQQAIIPPRYSEIPSPFAPSRIHLNNSAFGSESSQNQNVSQNSVLQNSQISIRQPSQNISTFRGHRDNYSSSTSDNSRASSAVNRTGSKSRNSRSQSQSQSQQQSGTRSLDSRHQQWENHSSNSSRSSSICTSVRYNSRSSRSSTQGQHC